ncbi:MAG: alpha-amylase family glycosyl hydrolase [Chloroflexota bacterium]
MLNNTVVYELSVRNHSKEGTLAKVTEDLERLKALGVDIVYLMPIHPISKLGRKGEDGSLYAIQDYRRIREDMGDIHSLSQLIEKAHGLGMKIVMDVVFNHTGRDSVLLKEHPEWFRRDENGNPSRKFQDWSDIYDLDYSWTGLWDYLIDVLRFWAELGVDGFRCDVASMIPLEFWITARYKLNATHDLIWIAESAPPAFLKQLRKEGYVAHSDIELYRAFDITYDYDGREYLERYWRGQGELKEYLQHIHLQEVLAPATAIKLRFLENHDLPRMAEIVTSPTALRNWTAFFLLLPGASMIYAGQEIKATKQSSLFEKDLIPWENGDRAFEDYLRTIIATAKKIKQACQQFEISEISRGVVHICWSGETDTYSAILNLEDRFGSVTLPEPLEGYELLSNSPVLINRSYNLPKEPLILKRGSCRSDMFVRSWISAGQVAV